MKNREAYLGILVARYTRKVTSWISAAKAVFNMYRTSSAKLHLNLRNKFVKCYIWNIALYDAERLKLQKIDHKYPESFEICCWRMIMKISGNDRVKNRKLLDLHSGRLQINILNTIKLRKRNWIGHVLRRNCFLKHHIQGKVENTRRRGRRHKQLLDKLNKKREDNCNLKEEELDCNRWRTRFDRGYGPVARETSTWVRVGHNLSQSESKIMLLSAGWGEWWEGRTYRRRKGEIMWIKGRWKKVGKRREERWKEKNKSIKTILAVLPIPVILRKQHFRWLIPDDSVLKIINDWFITYGMRLRLYVCAFVTCYKVDFKSGYQKERRSTSWNWIYRTVSRRTRIEKRFSGVSALS